MSKNNFLQFIAVSILAELMTLNCLWQLEFILTVFCYQLVQFSNLNFLFGKYSSWANTGYCIFSNLHFFGGKYSSWERIGSCKEVQFLGENGDSNETYKRVANFFANYRNIFHKTEVQTVILSCLMGLNLNLLKRYDTKRKNFHFRFFSIL